MNLNLILFEFNHFDFKRGATFLGIKKSARIGCISHKAKIRIWKSIEENQ